MKAFAISFFHSLRGLFSGFLPGACRFYPSCSHYMAANLEKRGMFSGMLRGFWRICRCHPFSRGGYDPVE